MSKTNEQDIHATQDGGTDTSELQSKTLETSQPKKRRAMEKRSEVWDHFERFTAEDGSKKSRCMHCGKVYCGDSKQNGTTSLHNHIKVCKKIPSSTYLKQKLLFLQVQAGNNLDLSTWKFDQAYIRKTLAEMIIIDELPFKFVGNVRFKRLMAASCPRFQIPSRWTISRDCFQLYIDEKNMLRTLLKSSKQRVCLTTDTWSSMQLMNYMCLTAHYIDDDWKLHKKIINFCTISSHRGKDIGWEIEKCLNEWEIEKVLTITVDNASSNDTAIDYLKEQMGDWRSSIRGCQHIHMRCIAHIINLVVKDGLKEVGMSIKRVRNPVRYVRSSPARLKKFKECCDHEKISTKSMLCLDVSTRWNSTYLMLNAAHKFEKAFYKFDMQDAYFRADLESRVDVENGDKIGVPTKEDWKKAKRMLGFLKVFYETTCRISGSLYVTCNMFLHEIYKMYRLLEAWINCHDEDLSEMSKKMKAKFDKYWGDPKRMNKIIFFAVVLDPRYKLEWVELALCKMYGDDLGLSMGKELKDEFVALCNDYKKPRALERSDEHIGGDDTMVSGEIDVEDPVFEVMMMMGSEYEQYHSRKKSGPNEVEKFLNEEIEGNDPKFDILAWWKLNEPRFPILSKVARDILAIPISTVASESAFSLGGRVLDAFRSSLTPKVVQSLICAQDWFRDPATPINVEEDLDDLNKLEDGLRGIAFDSTD